MQIKTTAQIATATLLAATAGIASAGTINGGAVQPVVDGADVASMGATNGSHKTWAENSGAGNPKGQTFTTGGSDVLLNSVTLRMLATNGATDNKTWALRVLEISKPDANDHTTWVLTEIANETMTQPTDWFGETKASDEGQPQSHFGTFALTTSVALDANTQYAFDVGMTSTVDGWQTGIAYILRTASDDYAGGEDYQSQRAGDGVGTADVNWKGNTDLWFHADMDVVPEPGSLALLGLGGLLIARRRRQG